MHEFVSFTLSGVTQGMIYSALAMSLVLIWRGTRIVNFAQGAMGMITTYVAITVVDRGDSYWWALVIAILAGVIIGGLVELVLVRPVESKPPLNAVIVTLGLLILLEAIAGMVWGGRYRSFPPAFSVQGVFVGSSRINLSPFDIFTICAVLAVMVGLLVLFRWTSIGLRMRAAAFEPEVARLLGVRVGRMLTLGWALAAGAGSLAGLLVAPNVFLYPSNMDAVLVYGFTAAILGGLDSPVGALIGGLGIGLALSYIGGYEGASLETIGALVILIALLMVRPEGLFTRVAPRRV
ncbi:MAG TPA: branched-chain amino acid ABC transporter permease [Acidimicrobiales bacterium]|nr:branched-chain amino acid ABC transporter permease [Acidimicrobiales bacterium]